MMLLAAQLCPLHQVPRLIGGRFRLPTLEMTFGPGDGHGLASPPPGSGQFQLGHHRSHVEQQAADWVSRSWMIPGRAGTFRGGQLGQNVGCVGPTTVR